MYNYTSMTGYKIIVYYIRNCIKHTLRKHTKMGMNIVPFGFPLGAMRAARIDKLYVAVRSEGTKFQKQYTQLLFKKVSTFAVVFLRRILHAEIPNCLF